MINKNALLVLVGGMFMLAGNAASAQSQGMLSGSVSLGTRSVAVSGSESKYREDVDLDSGLRLFDVAVNFQSRDEDAAIDRFEFSANGLGGDPYENIHIGIRNNGAWRLRLDRRRSSYFYEDTILPVALASVSASTAGDLHYFDFERVRDSAELQVDLSPATRVTVGLERQSRTGDSTTTLDIERDEFEIDKPLDESFEAARVGVTHEWQAVTLIVEEEFSQFENSSELFLPGASMGQNMADTAELRFFFFDQLYDYSNRSHLVRVLAEPSERVELSAFWQAQSLDLDLQAAERSAGTGFAGAGFANDLSGNGDAGRRTNLGGFDFRYAVGDRAAVFTHLRSSTLDQDGALLFGPDTGSSQWDIENQAVEFGGEVLLGSAITLSAGWSTESRDVLFDAEADGAGSPERHNTDRNGFVSRLRYASDENLVLTVSIEDDSIDDPFALASPTDTMRYRISVRKSWDFGLALQAGLQKTDVENETSGWMADTEQADLRLTYRWARVEVSGGLADIDIARQVDRLLAGGSIEVPFPVDYAANPRRRDLTVRWNLSDRIALGTSFASYDNRGSFRLERDDHRAFLAYSLPADYTLEARYRDVDFADATFDSYDADILELAFRLDW